MRIVCRKFLAVGVVTLLAITMAPEAMPQYEPVHRFVGGAKDGFMPGAGLVTDGAGNFFGVTTFGGTDGPLFGDYGTVYKIHSDGTFKVLHSFGGLDGAHPNSTLLLHAGTLYGTTQTGTWVGAGGNVFKVNTDGSDFQVLHAFTGVLVPETETFVYPDGNIPSALTLDASGNLYGTTVFGGTADSGTVFTVKTDGTGFNGVYDFSGIDGAQPSGHLVLDGNSLYGTTFAGGLSDSGTVYRLSTAGIHTLLHSFGGIDGRNPLGGLVADSSGVMYGTTRLGGFTSQGTAFKISTNGVPQVIHHFGTSVTDGVNPDSPLILSGGRLYGVTFAGGQNSAGTVFALQPDGSGFSFLHHFERGDQGAAPIGAVALDSTGVLFGTTVSGGINNGGVVFKLTGIDADVDAPVVNCDPGPDQLVWYRSNLVITCRASDSGGLADPNDAEFTLSTSVPAGTETGNAMTDSRLICDQADNCTGAGPFGAYQIDLKPPTITLRAPLDDAVFVIRQRVTADYECSDAGSQISNCSGPVPPGLPIDTATTGSKEFEVEAVDHAGNRDSLTVHYTVITAPMPASVKLDSNPNPSPLGQTATITATVTGAASAPLGSVTFFVNGAQVLGPPASLNPATSTTSTATHAFTPAAPGRYEITANYNSSDAANASSTTAAPLVQIVAPLQWSGTAARVMLRGLVPTGTGTFAAAARDADDGAFSRDTALRIPLRNRDDSMSLVGASYANGGLSLNGAAVRAYGLTFEGSSGGVGAARAIAYTTYVNDKTSTVQRRARAKLTGAFNQTGVKHAVAIFYVFDRDAFLAEINNSGKNLDEFLVSGDTEAIYAGGNPAALSLSRLFPLSALKASVHDVSSAGQVDTILETSLVDVDPGKAVITVFDLIVYSEAGGFVDFSATFQPAPVFFTDADGNAAPLPNVALWSPEPPAAANLALTPAATTNSLTTTATVTATATTASGEPVPNTQVFLDITAGPNMRPLGPSVTDANGQVSFAYVGGTATGTDQIQARIGTLQSNVAEVTWTPGPLDHITMSPSTAAIAAGGTQIYAASAFDAFDNSIGDVTGATTFTIALDGSCGGATCTASVPGTHTVTATYNGKTATATLEVTGVPSSFTFEGFFAPVDMSSPDLIVWNTVKAGQAVPLKWLLTLGGSPVSDPGSFGSLASYPVACSSGAGSIEDAIEQTASGNSGLQYNDGGNWQYNWKTPSSYKNTCRAVVVRFTDGTVSPPAHFKFK